MECNVSSSVLIHNILFGCENVSYVLYATLLHADDLRQICAPLMYTALTPAVGYTAHILGIVLNRMLAHSTTTTIVLCVCVFVDSLLAHLNQTVGHIFYQIRGNCALPTAPAPQQRYTKIVCLFKAFFTIQNQIKFNQEIYSRCDFLTEFVYRVFIIKCLNVSK